MSRSEALLAAVPTPLVRPATAADDAFLRAVHGNALDAQRQRARAAFPFAVDSVVEVGGEPVGRLWADRGPAVLTVLDVTLLPARRGAGIGTVLLRGLQAEAAALDVPLEVRVPRQSPALRLFERLGLRVTGDDGHVHVLRWQPPGHAAWSAAVGAPGHLAGVTAVPVECSEALRCGTYEQFSVIVRVPAESAVGPGKHRFEHPSLGALDMCVAAAGCTADGRLLTAAFARHVPATER